jgi:glycosyltransferase involved in cell wall biosynthesis
MSMENLPISVIIIARNAGSTIEGCLSSVRAQNPAEIIVVDGNSTDETLEITRRYTDRIYSDNGKGKTFARQIGAEQSTQEYIAYIDSDVVLAEGALETMLAEFRDSGNISISARQLSGTAHPSYWEWAGWQHQLYSHIRRGHQYLATMACLLRRETILTYEFDFSPGGYVDDTLLELRLKKEGYTFGVSSAVAYHNHDVNFRDFTGYRYFLGSLNPTLVKKQGPFHAGFWPPLVALYWLGFCLVKGKLKLIPYFVVNGVVETAGMAKGFLELIKGHGR